jgi:hypothetical protein
MGIDRLPWQGLWSCADGGRAAGAISGKNCVKAISGSFRAAERWNGVANVLIRMGGVDGDRRCLLELWVPGEIGGIVGMRASWAAIEILPGRDSSSVSVPF